MSRKDDRARGGAAAAEQVQALFAAAVRAHQAGRLVEAEGRYRDVLALAPAHAQSLYFLGIVALQANRLQAAREWIAKAVALEDGVAEWHYNLGFACQGLGRLDEAATHYARASALAPSDLKAPANLGNVHSAQGRLEEAAQCYRRVLTLQGDTAPICANLANVLARQERWAEADALYARALALAPDAAGVITNSGIALAALGQTEEALARQRRAVALDPNLVEARMNLGAALQAERRLDDALAQYQAVVALRPDHAEAHNNIGIALMAQNDLGRAADHFAHAAALAPKHTAFSDNLARALLWAGDTAAALAVLTRALAVAPNPDTKRLVVWCLTGLTDFPRTRELRDLVLRALAEAWGRIDDFAHVGAALVTLEPAIAAAVARAVAAFPRRLDAQALLGDALAGVAHDPLLRCLLESCPIGNPELERFLTALRSVILDWAEEEPQAADVPHALVLGAALAQQCFINEYAYAVADDELPRVERVRARLLAALAADAPVPPLTIAASAAYGPLHELPGVERLLQRDWPDPVRRVLVQQVEEPRAEAALRPGFPALTPIEDAVSREVRQQYEQNPYPRWVKPAPAPAPTSLRAFLREFFPAAPLAELPNKDGVDILIAGCGTGQHPIETARHFADARVLALDLSRASLAYAQRKSRELGLGQIAFAQADILNLGTLDRRFDLVESFGVLHHLQDPWRGWRVLVSLLRPGGIMNIGLYSELARQDVVSARDFIAERGYGDTIEEIRRFRGDVLALDPAHPLRAVLARRDFYSTSNCRDLLFHVQEHRMTLPQIKAFVIENDLAFLGFVLDSRLRRLYAACFPDDPAQTDLDNWHAFETENPKTFVGLYQLWLQKRAP